MRRITLLTNPDVCNLRCPLCFLNQRKRPFGMGEMPIEVARTAIERYAGMNAPAQERLREVIPSTMGEPLLYSKFRELLDYCRALGIPMNLTTNGTFPGFWGTETGMAYLLEACSDIKVSCMGFDVATFTEMMPGMSFDTWKGNVLGLLKVRDGMRKEGKKPASVSLQVTLHKKMVTHVVELLSRAEEIGVDRIKWNLPVFISAGKSLAQEYGVDRESVQELRRIIRSGKLSCEGSLFFDGRRISEDECLFKDEVWIMPDGSEEKCPNPERRFGDRAACGAKCEGCLLLNPVGAAI